MAKPCKLPSFRIEMNENGIYVPRGTDHVCVLSASMNLLKWTGEMNDLLEAKMVCNFGRLTLDDPRMGFAMIHKIPQTLEFLTDGAFFGKLVAVGATDLLRKEGVENPVKYSLEEDSASPPLLYLSTIENGKNYINHLIAVPSFDAQRGFLVVEGEKTRYQKAFPKSAVYKLEKVVR